MTFYHDIIIGSAIGKCKSRRLLGNVCLPETWSCHRDVGVANAILGVGQGSCQMIKESGRCKLCVRKVSNRRLERGYIVKIKVKKCCAFSD